MIEHKYIGKNIGGLCESKGISPETLCQLIGKPDNTSLWYTHGAFWITYKELCDICRVLECNPRDILGPNARQYEPSELKEQYG